MLLADEGGFVYKYTNNLLVYKKYRLINLILSTLWKKNRETAGIKVIIP